MNSFFIIKIFGMLLILLLLGLPYLPWNVKFTLCSARYLKKHSWKNIAFVLETLVVGAVLLCIAPLLKAFFMWLFNLGFMKWILDKLSARTTYSIESVVILALNFVLAFLFVIVKNSFRGALDAFVFKKGSETESDEEQEKKRKKKNRKVKNRKRQEQKKWVTQEH